MTREEIFAPAIEIPESIQIQCFEFDRWWKCYLVSETLCYDKGIVCVGTPIHLQVKGFGEDLSNKVQFIAEFLRQKKHFVRSVHTIEDSECVSQLAAGRDSLARP